MPDSPEKEKWLNDRERAIAIKRVADDQLGLKDSKSSWPNDVEYF
jgi:MFS transporter, ACS family, allantoate permease